MVVRKVVRKVGRKVGWLAVSWVVWLVVYWERRLAGQ
jgi:hypothetical protein